MRTVSFKRSLTVRFHLQSVLVVTKVKQRGADEWFPGAEDSVGREGRACGYTRDLGDRSSPVSVSVSGP